MVLAHFVSSGTGVVDLPAWALAYGVFMVLVLTVLWTRSRYVVRRPVPSKPSAARNEPGRRSVARVTAVAATAARGVAAVVLIMLIVVAWTGHDEIGSNIAPIAVIGVYWALGGWVSVVIGRWWTVTDPFMLVAHIGDRRNTRARSIPWWPGALVLATFIIVWVAWPTADNPRNLALWLSGYAIAMVLVAALRGSAPLRHVNVLPRVLDFCATILPRHASRTAASPDRRYDGLLATMVLGAIGGNRFAGSGWYLDHVADRSTVVITFVNAAAIITVGLFIAGIWWAAERRVESSRAEPASRPVIGALVPIAGSVLLADMFLIGVVQLENFVVLASDPFSRGWNLFGTVFWEISQTPVSPMIGGLTQAFVLLAGHMAALGRLARSATAPVGESTTIRIRNQNWMATLPAAALIVLSGVAWTLLLLGT